MLEPAANMLHVDEYGVAEALLTSFREEGLDASLSPTGDDRGGYTVLFWRPGV